MLRFRWPFYWVERYEYPTVEFGYPRTERVGFRWRYIEGNAITTRFTVAAESGPEERVL